MVVVVVVRRAEKGFDNIKVDRNLSLTHRLYTNTLGGHQNPVFHSGRCSRAPVPTSCVCVFYFLCAGAQPNAVIGAGTAAAIVLHQRARSASRTGGWRRVAGWWPRPRFMPPPQRQKDVNERWSRPRRWLETTRRATEQVDASRRVDGLASSAHRLRAPRAPLPLAEL